MQNQTTQVSVAQAKERLSNAISRLENVIATRDKKQSFEKEVRQVVVKELDTYIGDLENILLSKQE